MAEASFRVLSTSPLNSEPPLSSLISSFLTPSSSTYNRNHGAPLSFDPSTYTLSVTSEVTGLAASQSSFSLESIKAAESKTDVVAVLACAGNRRMEMNAEKEVEGLQWGASALANTKWTGALLRDVLAQAGLSLDRLAEHANMEKLHLHFETSQNCEEDTTFRVSLPAKMALDPERPVLLAYSSNEEPLSQAHGAPLRLVVPGIIGARSVKWIERIVLRDYESDGFYQQRDYKILPPQATPETKEDFLKQTPAMMEYPLNAEICIPAEGDVLSAASTTTAKPSVTVKGYAMGAHGIPIASVHVTTVPLPLSSSSSAATDLPTIRKHASSLPSSAWVTAKLVSSVEEDQGKFSARKEGEKLWGWTLFEAEVPLEAFGGEGTEVALIAYAEDIEGNMQQLQTEWNLRGVAESSWSVVKIKVKQE